MSQTIPWQPGHSDAPLPPLVPGLPVLGSALPMMKDPLRFLVEQHHKHGPVFRVQAANRRFTVLAGLQVNQFMAREGDAYLSGRDSWHVFAREVDSKYFLAMIDGEDHSRMRKVLKKPYSRANILTKLPEVVDLARQYTQPWQAGSQFVVFPTMQRMIAEQIGTMLLGKGPGEIFPDFVVFMQTLLNAVLGQWPQFMLKMPRYQRAKARVMALAADMLARHRSAETPPADPDLVDYLLNASKENPDIFTESELLLGALGPYLAGIDTAAGTSSFMLYALMKNPGVVERLLPEIDAAFARGPLTPEVVRGMELLHAATLESLRMYPVAPMLPRTVVQPFEFAGHRLEVGEPVMLANGVVHFDPKIYTNPDTFDIDRMLDPRKEHRVAGALAPYGLGAHTCAGAGFAEVEILVTVATLLHDFHLELANPAYELRTTFSPSPAPDTNFQIRVQGRRKSSSI